MYVYIYGSGQVEYRITVKAGKTVLWVEQSASKLTTRSSFKHRDKWSTTELGNYIWQLKDQDIPYQIKWSNVQHTTPFNLATKCCNLCISEKFNIITKPESVMS